jgi:Restriction endonuclease
MNKHTSPFRYPSEIHVRKHAPKGYKQWNDFRDWLRDEFDFRCVYCLCRETWGRRRATWVVEHVIPRTISPDLALDYNNLVYSCASCNSAKSSKNIPDPCKCMYGDLIYVSEDGCIHALNAEGKKLIRVAALDEGDLNKFRKMIIDLIKEYKKSDREKYKTWMGFPDDLPDLSKKKVPENGNPESYKICRYYQRAMANLPDIYE